MSYDQETYQLISRYLSQDLTEQELNSFNDRLSSDGEFAKEVKIHELGNDLIIESRLKDVSSKTQTYADKVSPGVNWKNVGFVAAFLSAGLFLALYTALNLKEEEPVKEEKIEVPQTSKVEEREVSKPVNEIKEANKTDRQTMAPVETEENNLTRPLKEKQIPAPENLADTVQNEKVEEEVIEKEYSSIEEEEKAAQKTSQGLSEIDCMPISIDAITVKTEPSCSTGKNGKIELFDIPEGYKVSLGKKNDFTYITTFAGLSPGVYPVKMKDPTGCKTEARSVTVPSKSCREEINLSFNPEYEEVIIPNTSGSSTLTILDPGGNVIFEAAQQQSDYSWDGTNQYGSLMNAGNYKYIVTPDEGEKISGFITVMR